MRRWIGLWRGFRHTTVCTSEHRKTRISKLASSQIDFAFRRDFGERTLDSLTGMSLEKAASLTSDTAAISEKSRWDLCGV